MAAPTRGLDPARMARLGELESWHFWFEGRRALVGRLVERHAPRARRVVDVGCGTGWLATKVAPKGAVVAGFDVEASGIRLGPTAGRVGAGVAAGEALPARDQCADLVLLTDVLEHADDAA